jgi:hypothetical protein
MTTSTNTALDLQHRQGPDVHWRAQRQPLPRLQSTRSLIEGPQMHHGGVRGKFLRLTYLSAGCAALLMSRVLRTAGTL